MAQCKRRVIDNWGGSLKTRVLFVLISVVYFTHKQQYAM
jgi:hypothetical protein